MKIRDFTLSAYAQLLISLLKYNYRFVTFEESIGAINEGSYSDKYIILRHDVDLIPQNSLFIAQLEHSLKIRGTYYFRVIPKSNHPVVINLIADLGHEIGYHYEDISLFRGDVGKAFENFQRNLDYFRKFYPVKTICMHGSPRSKYDNKDLWKIYDYRSLGIIAEPYLDLDFNEWLYITDTGRRWDGWKTSVRDKIPQQEKWVREGLVFHSTDDIIMAAEKEKLPSRIMITVHPQRWTEKHIPWVKELILQSAKNVIKKWFFVK